MEQVIIVPPFPAFLVAATLYWNRNRTVQLSNFCQRKHTIKELDPRKTLTLKQLDATSADDYFPGLNPAFCLQWGSEN